MTTGRKGVKANTADVLEREQIVSGTLAAGLGSVNHSGLGKRSSTTRRQPGSTGSPPPSSSGYRRAGDAPLAPSGVVAGREVAAEVRAARLVAPQRRVDHQSGHRQEVLQLPAGL